MDKQSLKCPDAINIGKLKDSINRGVGAKIIKAVTPYLNGEEQCKIIDAFHDCINYMVMREYALVSSECGVVAECPNCKDDFKFGIEHECPACKIKLWGWP